MARSKRVLVEVDGDDVAQMVRRLRDVADQLDKGYTDGLVEKGPDGDYEFHVYNIKNAK